MIGLVFNDLTVRSSAGRDSNGSILWLCDCRCGNTTTTRGSRLRCGDVRSCGCLKGRLAEMRLDNMPGKRFGDLLVVKFIERNKCGHDMWECECACGKTSITDGSNLRSGHTKSCGCKQGFKLHDISGQMFGKMEPLYVDESWTKTREGVKWICRCHACGSIHSTRSHTLVTGDAVSCGCLQHGAGSWMNKYGKINGVLWNGTKYRSKVEVFFAMIATMDNIKFMYEPKTFDISVNGENRRYTPDFFILNIWIEVKGKNYEITEKIKNFGKIKKIKLFDLECLSDLINVTSSSIYNHWDEENLDKTYDYIYSKRTNAGLMAVLQNV